MNIKKSILIAIVTICSLGIQAQDNRPNILWITIEDWSPDLSCYGTPGISTPHVDKLASQGVRFNRAFTTSPVCSTSRSAMMTGFHQNYIQANQHRLNSDQKQALPHGVKPIPHIMRDAGYYTCLMSWKTDCNFKPFNKEDLFEDVNDYPREGKIGWRNRKSGQPFFARITFGGTHRKWYRDPQRPIDTKDVVLPPYYADTEFTRRDWANGLEQMQLVDREIGGLLQVLEDDGLADNTIVIFIGDHGRCHFRGKQFLYDGGIQIPMVIRWPGKVKPGTVNEDLVQSIDICQTILDAAETTPPKTIHGKNLFSEDVKNRKYVYAARDKMDQTHDAMRAIRSKDFKLIHNLMPERPYLQYNMYKEGSYPMIAEMNILNLKGKLTPEQALFFAPTKPEFELFDLNNDPHELKNLANNPKYARIKDELLTELYKWRTNVILDQGVTETFRALNVFPEKNPYPTVDQFVMHNKDNYNYLETGWPSWYPTRTLKEWERARKMWEPWVMRSADSDIEKPFVNYSKATKKKKKPKK